jgi:superfamily II DNA or RNA helicase
VTAPELRPYQVEAIAAARERFRAGDRGTLIVLPTGTGKTVVFAEIARLTVERGRRVLVLAHRSELLKQALAKLRAVGVRAALEQGPNRAGDADVVVASVATLKAKRLAAWASDAFGVIVIDEAHHATSKSYRAIVDHFAGAKVLGVTATPDRADGVGLDSLFGERACYTLPLRDAIAAGYLVNIRARSVKVDVDLDAIKRTRGDFDVGELSEAMTEAAVLDASARALLAERGHRPTIAFTVDVAHAHKLAAAINAHRPGLAVAVSGDSSDDERTAAADGLIAGSIGIVCNAALWTEGFDCPPVSCIAILRPTGSRGLFAQMIGRGTRPNPPTGKTDVLVLDFAGTTQRHRLVSAADVLEGDLPDDVAALVVEELRADGGGDVEAAIAKAKAHLAAVRNAPIARWLSSEVGDLLGEDVDVRLCRDGFGLASPTQLDALKGLGFYRIPVGLTDLAAAKLIAVLANRSRRGLCSYKQAGMLARRGVPADRIRTMRKGEASDELERLGAGKLGDRDQRPPERVTADRVPLRRPE